MLAAAALQVSHFEVVLAWGTGDDQCVGAGSNGPFPEPWAQAESGLTAGTEGRAVAPVVREVCDR